MESTILFSHRLIRIMKEQGRSKEWLLRKLMISRPTLDKKIRENSFTNGEISIAKSLLFME